MEASHQIGTPQTSQILSFVESRLVCILLIHMASEADTLTRDPELGFGPIKGSIPRLTSFLGNPCDFEADPRISFREMLDRKSEVEFYCKS